jgi:thiamine biosynthesis lipoprotein
MIVAVAPAKRAEPFCHAIEAMATRFEIVLPDGSSDGGYDARAVAEDALAEIARLDSRLSIYQPMSDVSWINGHAGQREVKVEPRLFALLQRCVELSEATDGAFDVTVGPLMRAWKFVGDTGALPSPDAVAGARSRAGYQHLRLDPGASTIRFARDGMAIDLGAVGKGFAIDEAIAILRAHGVNRALLHGGTSSVHAIGCPADGDAWRIAWSPRTGGATILELRDSALSVSAQHGKAFFHDGHRFGHVFDPGTGWPADGPGGAVVTGPRSLECDALSTALLVNGGDWLRVMRLRFPDYDGMVV